ncbi:MAG TPA: chloride channel protein, partial [Thermodesulfobacteriaceae bacterium]|nr:chloride channel protein [Thermodesulfobacteriaceae bacterium]
LGGLGSGLLVAKFCPEAQGHGTDSAIKTYHHKEGFIHLKVPIIKTFASFLTLGTGGSGGSEGPICQIGAGLGSVLAQKLRLTNREMRVLMAAGMGAGVGAIFRAPLTGALFASEILYRDPEFEADVVIPSAIASTVAYSLFCSFFGWGSMFEAADFRFDNVLALGPYTVLALAISLGVFLFVKIFWGLHDFFQGLRLPIWIKPAIGGLITGTIGLALPGVLGFSYGFLQEGLDNNISMYLFAALALGKILATSFSIGSGGSGGVFGPSVVIGGCIGGAVGMLFHDVMPGIVSHSAPFIMVGMAGFFAGSSNVPITAVIVVSEITGSYHLLLPSMLVCSVCYFLCRKWNLYRDQVANKVASPAHKGDFFSDVLENIQVKDIFNPTGTCAILPESMNFAQFCRFFRSVDQHYFPVVNDDNILTGIFSVNDVRHCLFDVNELGSLVIVKDIARKDIITTTPSEDVNTLFKKFTIRNIDRIPVVTDDDPHDFQGMISRREVINFYNRSLDELKDSTSGTGRKEALPF